MHTEIILATHIALFYCALPLWITFSRLISSSAFASASASCMASANVFCFVADDFGSPLCFRNSDVIDFNGTDLCFCAAASANVIIFVDAFGIEAPPRLRLGDARVRLGELRVRLGEMRLLVFDCGIYIIISLFKGKLRKGTTDDESNGR